MATFFQKEDPNVLNSYGYTFRLTKHHMTPEQLDPLKHKYDVLGSEASEVLDALYPPPPPRAGWYSKTKAENPQPDRDTYALLRDNVNKDPKLQKLWDEVNTVPEWVDWEQIQRGQDVFYRYAPAAVAGFAFQGLLATTVCLTPMMLNNQDIKYPNNQVTCDREPPSGPQRHWSEQAAIQPA